MNFNNRYSTIPFSEIRRQLEQIAYPFLEYLLKSDNAAISDKMRKSTVFPAHMWRTFVKTHYGHKDPDHVTDLINSACAAGFYEPLSVRETSEVLGINTRNSGAYVRVRQEHLQNYVRALVAKLPMKLDNAPLAPVSASNAAVSKSAEFNAAPAQTTFATAASAS